MQDNKNFILAIVLSIAVLLGWQYFVAGPQVDEARQQQAEQQQQQQAGSPADSAATGSTPSAPGAPGDPSATPGGAVPATTATRDEALARSPRVPVDTAQLTGSISLTGGRIDDLRLDGYRETTDPDSPSIVLLSPSGGPDGYFAEFGWVAPAGGPEVPGSATEWTAPQGARLTAETPVTLTWDNGAGLVFRRTVALDDQYMFTITDAVENSTGAPVTLYPYGRVARLGGGHTAGWYILHEGPLGVFGDAGLRELSYSELEEEGEIAIPEATRGWLGITDKYWATALIPDQERPFHSRFTYTGATVPIHQADFRGDGITVADGASGEITSRLFAGAKVVAVVDGYQNSLGIERFELLIDWGWFYFITKPMFFALDWFFRLFGNFGVAILLVTVIIKLAFFPLANKSYKSMSMMKKLQPQMMELRERYKDDRVKQQQALMEMYKKEKVNPVAGCWPVLLQIPVFFALYKVLFVTIEMRHAPFFGWIRDLAAPDPTTIFNLFGLIPWDPPTFLMLGIWPIIMGITMWVQMRLNPAPPDPAQQMIFNWMPVVFTFMLASFPAGLVIYWAWNNTLSVIQQAVIMRRQGVEIDLLGNIRSSFRRRKPDKADAKG